MNYEIIDKALKSLDIKENFIIIHSNLLAFFKKTHHKPEKVWREIFENYKNKTIIMPTFTFSINKNKKRTWDYNRSKSETGSLTEFLEKKFQKEEQYILFILFLFMVLITKTFQNIIANQVLVLALLGNGWQITKMFVIYQLE